jgi:hypothetical protein
MAARRPKLQTRQPSIQLYGHAHAITGDYTGNYWRLPAITAITGDYGDYRRLPVITGDYLQLPAITGNYQRLPAITGDYG